MFQYSLAGRTVPAVPVPRSVPGKTVPTVPVSGFQFRFGSWATLYIYIYIHTYMHYISMCIQSHMRDHLLAGLG